MLKGGDVRLAERNLLAAVVEVARVVDRVRAAVLPARSVLGDVHRHWVSQVLDDVAHVVEPFLEPADIGVTPVDVGRVRVEDVAHVLRHVLEPPCLVVRALRVRGPLDQISTHEPDLLADALAPELPIEVAVGRTEPLRRQLLYGLWRGWFSGLSP